MAVMVQPDAFSLNASSTQFIRDMLRIYKSFR
jgi:hypothetical protein